jgi:hypothetical protein
MKKLFIISSLTVLAALCLCVTAQAQGPVVVSDKDDYSPGETALFSAAGFEPNELLDFSVAISDENGEWIPDIAWADVPADASGGTEVDYIVPQTWANKSLQLTVMGLTSGLIATTTFTDTVDTISLNSPTTGAPVHVTTAGGSVIANISYTTSCTGGGCGANQANVHFQIDGVDYAGNQFNGEANDAANVNYTVTVPASLAIGCHDLRLQVARQGNGTATQTCSIIVDAPASPTPIPTATPTATPCQNNPPVVTCLMPTTDLGAVVGCLGTGTGFGQTFPVSYAVVDGTGNTKIVQATFTLPDSSTVGPVDVASITDSDAGDTISVMLSNETTSITISGPGTGSASYQLDIHADDNHDCNNTADNTCGGTASADIVYGFSGFFPPLSGQVNTKVKQGSGIPVKFQITDCSGTLITPDNIPGPFPTIDVTFLSGAVPSGDPTVDDAGMSGDNGDTFRWDLTGMQWIFNLKTNSSYTVGDSYLIWADLHDGADHNVPIAIKR